MRRQARISAGGALLVRTASALQVWLWLLIFVFQNEFRISRSIQPGYLDFDNLPETNFTCEGKVIGGYYADLETSCQMFHVCTVGQQEEPMDIKFLCLNGTVFDQETRVCERVDEVDCTKSEMFYSLNLELYGSSTAPPIIKPDQTKSTEKSPKQEIHEEETGPSLDEVTNLSNHRNEEHQQDNQDSTEDPIQEVNSDQPHHPSDYVQPTRPSNSGLSDHVEPVEENQEEDEIDSENPEYEEDYTKTPPVTTHAPLTTTISKPQTTTVWYPSTSSQPSLVSHSLSPPTPAHSSSQSSTITASAPPVLDPALLSPQEFIYRHRGPGSEAISFQRQSFRPADGVYITHAPPQQQQQSQYDHFQYESSRTAPRPLASRPTPFIQRPPPTPFRQTTLDPRDQLPRPGPSSQSSERHETLVKHRQQTYLPPLPAQRPFDPYFYDRKRSDDIPVDTESTLAARSVAPPTETERPPTKPKSPPRVIVTASASVSDSNGKRLNYTVGNVVSAVKPIVPINYDDYKESDLIFDPFFLDVPKLQKRRKTRGSRNSRRIFTIPETAAISNDLDSVMRTTTASVTSQATTTEKILTTPSTTIKRILSMPSTTTKPTTTTTTTTAAWNPNDYVDDNYEPHAYIPPAPPLAVLLPDDRIILKKQEKPSMTIEKANIIFRKEKPIVKFSDELKPITSDVAQSPSSQYAATAREPYAATVPSAPAEHICATSDCRTRA